MKTVLHMARFSNMVMTRIKIWNKTSNDYAKMLITVDTGASITTISSDVLHALGYDTTTGPKNRITTASGTSYVRSVNLDMMIGTIQLCGIEVYAHAFPEECFSNGVLGLNVLSLFDVNFVFSKRVIEFCN